MLEFRTQGYNGYDLKYSPFHSDRIAVSTAANYGLVGNGRAYILGITTVGNIVNLAQFDTTDACYGIAWSEAHENHFAVACGDGVVRMYDGSAPGSLPLVNYAEHKREVYSWSPSRAQSILTLPTHSCTYSVAFSPFSPSVITSVSSDSHLRVFDIRTPASASNHLVSLIPIHGPAPTLNSQIPSSARSPPSECLTHDWNKYHGSVIATAGVDQMIRTFDLRNPNSGAMATLAGHRYAVRKLAWSPHFSDVLLSGSYDMSARIWTDGSAMGVNELGSMGPSRQLGEMDAHTEFVTGVDWCMFGAEGWVATTGWDERVCVWDSRAFVAR
ncbi:related to peroxisome biogenesis factor 7 [Rhynchosporium agropyri]|uniref:Peroxin-7 n=2 Tax=Rhynchosporium TaxID=38037 RepID=A0A1E1L7J2_9HELO|nr:related to peroxisome biogenesis factor 7 [Rhynchosporium commune]CZT06517.1 related to peroxisome biogenesis factor 7 [Rhynchosporium agropyri]